MAGSDGPAATSRPNGGGTLGGADGCGAGACPTAPSVAATAAASGRLLAVQPEPSQKRSCAPSVPGAGSGSGYQPGGVELLTAVPYRAR